ncbi:hypothetical protein [Photobacterium leiognathi]|uniref:hypothetical protein n=1 Tax=Photobacterium leiognathi TaxID=553611 RepID=UPI0027343764|nr:hypothetical protein [Photobacterium leiognathi]
MGDWEDVFGPGNGDWEPPREPKEISKKWQCYQRKKEEFYDVTKRLGFRWCLMHGVIAFPKLSGNAIFLDRKDKGTNERSQILSRLIIEPLDNVVRLTLITTKEEVKVKYRISDKDAYYNAILIALDFKFSTSTPFVNIDSMKNDKIYSPLKY